MTHNQCALTTLITEVLAHPELAHSDVFRRMLQAGLQDLIDAETAAKVVAAPHERSPERTTRLLPVLMLNNDHLQPLSVGLVNWRERLTEGIPYNITITGSLLAVIPLLIAFAILQRYWRSDLTAGGVK